MYMPAALFLCRAASASEPLELRERPLQLGPHGRRILRAVRRAVARQHPAEVEVEQALQRTYLARPGVPGDRLRGREPRLALVPPEGVPGEKELAVAAREISSLGTKVLALPCDVTVESQVESLFTRSLEQLGRLDISSRLERRRCKHERGQYPPRFDKHLHALPPPLIH